MAFSYPLNYQLQNVSTTKFLNVVVLIEGYSGGFSLVPTYKRVRYGDPDIFFGDEGLIWGGLKLDPKYKSYLSMTSNLVISQQVEPEQGRASAAIMSLEFIDFEGFMTAFVAPGQVFDEIMGSKQIKVMLGYQNTSFKEDYFCIFRGYITGLTSKPTIMSVQLTDANIKRKSQVFLLNKGSLLQIVNSFLPPAFYVGDNKILIAGHRLLEGNRVQLSSTGALPSPLAPGTDYYVRYLTDDFIQLSLTSGGAVIDLLNFGSGTHSIVLEGIGSLASKIHVTDPSVFLNHVLGPDGLYDTSLVTYLKIEDEAMGYGPTAIGVDYLIVTRGDRGTTAVDHAVLDSNLVASAIDNPFQLAGNFIDLSLKIMLSGWGTNWITNKAVAGFVKTNDADIGLAPNALVLPDGVDAVDDYGLAVGDYITTSGATTPGNNVTGRVTAFLDRLGYPNNIILTDQTYTLESPTTAVFASRSQYDTLPAILGTKLRGIDIDIAAFQDAQSQFFSGPENVFQHYITAPQSGKDWIEKEYMLPVGAYSITRFGRLSMSVTKPPIAGQNLVVLDHSNVIDPQSSVVQRTLNNRRFYNEIQYFYDYDDSDKWQSLDDIIDTNSVTLLDTSSLLPIQARGLRSANNASTLITKRGPFLIKRYANGAIQVTLKTNWQAASMVEASDILALYDNGQLKMSNLITGRRDLESQLWEVVQRSLDIKSGTGTLTLLTQNNYLIDDRFAGIAPSTLIIGGSTTTILCIKDSFGSAFPYNEKKKWEPIIGERILIHSADYSYQEETVLLGFVPGNNYQMMVSALSVAPAAGTVIDCAEFPNTTSKTDQQKTKILFCFVDPSIAIVAGVSTTEFTVASGDAGKFQPNVAVSIHNSDYSVNSPECIVDSIVGSNVKLKSSLGFVPAAGQIAELIGFPDGTGPFRIL
jgi:hypothetical protein